MKITKTVGFECESCKNNWSNNSNIIELSGEFEGRSDMPYEFHFCDILCLKREYESMQKPDFDTDDEYYFIIEEALNKRKNG